MTQYPASFLLVLLLMFATVPAVYTQTSGRKQVFQHSQQSALTEEFSFIIKYFKVEHQGEHNVLHIAFTMRYVPNVGNTDYPDYRAVARDIEAFLTNYPNEQDYWEIVNKGLTAMLLKKYPPLAMITYEIAVEPVQNSPYTRTSRVIRVRSATSRHK